MSIRYRLDFKIVPVALLLNSCLCILQLDHFFDVVPRDVLMPLSPLDLRKGMIVNFGCLITEQIWPAI